ncbi:hypothetical protein [Streptomyces sp. NPDC001070]
MIPAPVRERLAITTAEYNNCTYCLSAHTYTGAGVAKVGAGELPATRGPPTRTAALLALAHAIARGHIGETQLKAAGPWASPTPRLPSSWAIWR